MNEIQMNPHSSMSAEEIQSLNQKWQDTVAPKVCFQWGDYNNETEQSKSVKESYKLGETVAKIKTLQSEGKTICLFIGRIPLEKLPSDCSEAKENEVWVSADISFTPSEYCAQMIDSTDLTQRLYLWVDFNQQEGLVLIRGLFDKIIIDQSTVKGIRNDDFAKRFSILFHTSESEMVFEDPSWWGMRFDESSDKLFTFSTNNYATMFDLMMLIEKCESTNQEMNDLSWEISRAETKAHLETIFHSVQEHIDEPYPYQTNYNNEGKDRFYIVRNPK